eukprot:GHVN01065102.1.p1 GENE.GHVN01065102.1~~GHVN01065102.1.p1  ORF type:complete len:341 (-),score=88.27 GHVN01065102.1:1439-2461(-)
MDEFEPIPTQGPQRSLITVAFSVVQADNVKGVEKFRKFWNEPCVEIPWLKGVSWYTVVQAALISKQEEILNHLIKNRTDVDMTARSLEGDTPLMCAAQAQVSIKWLRAVLDNGGMHSVNFRDMSGKTALDYSDDKWEGKEILKLCGALTGEEIEQRIQEELEYQAAEKKHKKKKKKDKNKAAQGDEDAGDESSPDPLPADGDSLAPGTSAGNPAGTSSSSAAQDQKATQKLLAAQIAAEASAMKLRPTNGPTHVEDKSLKNLVGDQGGTGETGETETLSIEEQLRLVEAEEEASKARREELEKLLAAKVSFIHHAIVVTITTSLAKLNSLTSIAPYTHFS